MRVSGSRLSLLLSYGLSESEAKVYLALVDHPSMSAASLAKVAQVPRSHMYKVLADLHAHGLVDVLIEGKARAYRARPLAEFLEREARRLRERVAQMEAEMRTVAHAFVPPAGSELPAPERGDFRLTIGRKAVAREIDELLARAERSVLIAASDGSVDRLARHVAAWQETGPKDVTVTMILPSRTSLTTDLPEMELRRFRVPRTVFSVCADESRMIIVHPIPDSSDLRAGRDLGIGTDDASFVAAHAQLLHEASDRTARVGPPINRSKP